LQPTFNADYVLAQSQPSQTLWANKDWFEQAQAQNFAGIEVSRDEHVESSHHRIEKASSVRCPTCPVTSKLVGLTCRNGGANSPVMEQDHSSGAVLSHQSRVMRQPWRVLFACIGALKINCTGRMSLLQKMRLGSAYWSCTAKRTCDASRSIVSIASYPSNAAHGRNLIEQQWTMIICLKYSLLV